MADSVATISLKADVSDLTRASSALDNLSQRAGATDKAVDSLAKTSLKVKAAAAESASALVDEQRAVKGLLESIDPTLSALGKLGEQQASLKAALNKGWVSTDAFDLYQKKIDETRSKLTQNIDASALDLYQRKLDETRNKLTEMGEAAAHAQIELAAAQAAEKQSAALKGLLESIDPTIRAFNTLDEQYAQLVAHFEAGRINGAQFEHFNQQLDDTRRRLTGIADALPQALSRQELAAQRAGVSIGQYNAALRTLPAQFTDIATQLAGGQSPFLILLQQGGQIKDQFGSVKGAVSGVGSYLRTMLAALTPATVGIGALAVGAGALATAWYQGTQEAAEFNKQLILTGNYSAQSASQLSELALKIGGASGKVVEASRVLSQVAGVGTFKPEQLESVTRAAIAMERATGQSVDATVKNFQKLYDSPTKASAELNNTMHYLTASQFEYISALERRGDKDGAAEVAAKAYSQAEQQRSQQIINNMGLIERAANSTGEAIKGMWDKLLDVGRSDNPSQLLEKAQQDYEVAQNNFNKYANQSGTSESLKRQYQNILDRTRLALDMAEQQARSQQVSAQNQQKISQANADAITGQQDLNKWIEAGTTKTQKHSQAVAQLNKLIADNARQAKETQLGPADQRVTLWSDADIARARKGIDEMYKEAKTPKTPSMPAGDRTLLNYKAQASILDDTIARLKESGEVEVRNTEYSKVHNHFIELAAYAQGHLLSAQEKSQLANQANVELAAQEVDKRNAILEAQKKSNVLAKTMRDEQLKYQAQIRDITETAGMSSLQRQKYAETQQARLEFEKGGGDLNDQNNRATQEYYRTLDLIDAKYAKLKESQGDWMSGASSSMKNWMDEAMDTSKSAGEVIQTTMGGAIDSLVDTLNGSEGSWKSWGLSIIKIIEKVTMQLLVANSLKAAFDGMSGSSTSWIASIGSALGGTVAHAKGGVYETPGLHKYVNQIYDSPQYFAFQGASKYAKGGVFGEAGPEAIMPLARDSAGRLGIRAQGGGGGNTPAVSVSIGDINIINGNQQSQQANPGLSNAATSQLIKAVVDTVTATAAKPGPLNDVIKKVAGKA